MNGKILGLLAVGLLTGQMANAVTYDFTVTATSGTLSGQSSTGYFSFNQSIAPAGGGFLPQTGLLTDLSFSWDGISYTEATANTGFLGFSATGELNDFGFGTFCFPGVCSVSNTSTDWTSSRSGFAYGAGGFIGVGTVRLTLRAVPEPGTLALLGLGLAGLGLSRRRKAV